ncbi:MAG TPA: hypothetical protein VGP52_06210 [Stellaceae bacterium]|jgi:hypothetical protein|nr:hypothetical protein [Stellaceae bacterium]
MIFTNIYEIFWSMAAPIAFQTKSMLAQRGEIMRAILYVGPVLESSGRFSYDTFSLGEGRRSSFRYQRVEQARHDRNAMVAEAEANPNISVQICETAAEFRQQVATAGEPAACEEAKAGG